MLLSLLGAAPALASSGVVLDARWHRMLRPYSYVEERRFERGWHRGADVRTVDGIVRSPIDGRVVFTGAVAARQALTLRGRIDGRTLHVTLVGLRRIAALHGARVRSGQVVGSAQVLHVGAYDPLVRHRYLPVSVSEARAGAALHPHDGTLAGGIVRRLIDAIAGRAAPRLPRTGLLDAGSSQLHTGWLGAASTGAVSAHRRAEAVAARPPVVGRAALAARQLASFGRSGTSTRTMGIRLSDVGAAHTDARAVPAHGPGARLGGDLAPLLRATVFDDGDNVLGVTM